MTTQNLVNTFAFHETSFYKFTPPINDFAILFSRLLYLYFKLYYMVFSQALNTKLLASKTGTFKNEQFSLSLWWHYSSLFYHLKNSKYSPLAFPPTNNRWIAKRKTMKKAAIKWINHLKKVFGSWQLKKMATKVLLGVWLQQRKPGPCSQVETAMSAFPLRSRWGVVFRSWSVTSASFGSLSSRYSAVSWAESWREEHRLYPAAKMQVDTQVSRKKLSLLPSAMCEFSNSGLLSMAFQRMEPESTQHLG